MVRPSGASTGFATGPGIRRAFTLVELLAVVAVIGLLVAILLPAINSVREAARRAECSSNLKQVGTALIAFQASHGSFPFGLESKPDPLKSTTPHHFFRWSALAHITPYLEQEIVHELINFEEPMYRDNKLNPSIATAVATQVSAFLCPSDRRPSAVSDNGSVQYGFTNYVVCAGSGADGGTPFETDGVFYVNSRTRYRDMPDGSGHTVLASESTIGTGRESMGIGDRDLVNYQGDYATPLLIGNTAVLTEARCAAPQGWNITNRRGFLWASGEYRCALYNHYRRPNDLMIDCIGSRAWPAEDVETRFSTYGWRAARSRHAGGVNVLMADASVHFVDDTVDLNVWRAVSTREEGETARLLVD